MSNHIAAECPNCTDKIEPRNLGRLDEEIAQMDKHEVLCSIASSFGKDPSLLNVAEKIFESIKYQMTEYVLKHEFNAKSELSVELALWLEQKQQPQAAKPLVSLMTAYLKTGKAATAATS